MLRPNAMSVTQLNAYAKTLLEAEPAARNLCVRGEITSSSFRRYYHTYLTIKDDTSSLACFLPHNVLASLRFEPDIGMSVVLIGNISVDEKKGALRFNIDVLQPDGIGELAAAFEQLKAKLEKEGLFAQERKRQIPLFPHKIGVVTSDSGKAIDDILTVTGRRWPMASVLLCPALVQGPGAPPSLINALRLLNEDATCDVIIIGRGGGSTEDLWCFNDERLARAIAASKIPVISAVGHETDFTICDFVADKRAPTPSAAAEIAVPDGTEQLRLLLSCRDRMSEQMRSLIETETERLRFLSSKAGISGARSFLKEKGFEYGDLTARLRSAESAFFTMKNNELASLAGKLDAMSPLKVMSRGYAVAGKNGKDVFSVTELSPGDGIDVYFTDGEAKCRVESTRQNTKA